MYPTDKEICYHIINNNDSKLDKLINLLKPSIVEMSYYYTN